jgi:hypothetical protein
MQVVKVELGLHFWKSMEPLTSSHRVLFDGISFPSYPLLQGKKRRESLGGASRYVDVKIQVISEPRQPTSYEYCVMFLRGQFPFRNTLLVDF